jgi:aminomethyltransferase
MGYVRPDFAGIDATIYIQVREKLLQAKVSKIPFSA